MERLVIGLIALSLLLVACTPTTVVSEPTAAPSPTALSTTPAPASPPPPTKAPPTSTSTPVPTSTPTPTPFPPPPTVAPSTATPTGAPPTPAVDPEQLKDKWRTPIWALVLTDGAMLGLVEAAEGLEEDVVDSSSAFGDIFVVALIADAADEALAQFDAAPDQLEYVMLMLGYLANVQDVLGMWVEGEISKDDVPDLLASDLNAIDTTMVSMLETMQADGLTEDDLVDLLDELESAFDELLEQVEEQRPTPEPPSTPPGPIGRSRSNPYAPDQIASAPNMDVRVLEVVRGERAWQALEAANMFNEPAPDGWEHVLVKLWVKNTSGDEQERSISSWDFGITGERLLLYPADFAIVPEPKIDAELFDRGEAEGWVSFLIREGEEKLMLVVDEFLSFDEDRLRYIALQEGTSLTIDPQLADIAPTSVGKERSDPVALGQTATTENWQLTLYDVLVGDKAWLLIESDSPFAGPPEEGMQYVAVVVQLRNISDEEVAKGLGAISLRSTGDLGVLYDDPHVSMSGSLPEVSLYPGGVYSGWIVVQSALDETDLLLVFEPFLDWSGENRRYLSLEPQ